MTDDDLLAALRAKCNFGDHESDHGWADDLMAICLRKLGYTKSMDWVAEHQMDWWWA